MTTPADVRDPHFERRVRESFARQELMSLLGASLAHVAPGEVDIELPFSPRLTQQHGFLHAGAIASILDSACGYAASTLMDADAAVLTVEFKINLLEPAMGDRFVAHGRVVRAGRTVTVCRGDAVAEAGGGEKVVAIVTATVMTVRDRGISA
jgi:uncharacterized protein (TIGR00369 family)